MSVSRTIQITLSEESIEKLIKEMEDYKKTLDEKLKNVRDLVAAKIQELAQMGFDNSISDFNIKGAIPEMAKVKVRIESLDDKTLVIADGEDAVWVEFGAGVYFNGAAGSSPHPKGTELGFIIGNYGKGRGRQHAWGYYGDDGKLVITRGTFATMPMFHAVQAIEQNISEIAKKVFDD